MRALLAFALVLGLAACDSASPASTAAIRYSVSGPAAITYSTPDGTQAATASSAWDASVEVPAGTPVVLTALSSSGQPVEARIYVDGQLAKSSQGTSVRLSSSSSSSSSGEVEVEGPIESLAADAITVLGFTFAIDGSTAFLDDDNDPTTAAAFSVGQRVEVKGRGPASALRATRIKPDDDGFDDDGGGSTGEHVEREGTITALDAESITVGGVRFLTNASTQYLDDDNRAISRSAFSVGQLAEAEGHRRSDGTVLAYKVKLDDD